MRDWSSCEQRERLIGDGGYYVRQGELLRVLVKLLEPRAELCVRDGSPIRWIDSPTL